MGDRITTAIVVNVLDVSKLLEEAKVRYIEEHPEKKDPSMSIMYTWGVVETPAGTFALCNEGIINEDAISEEHPLQLDVYASYEMEDGKRGMEMIPCMRVSVDLKGIYEDTEVVDTQNLEEFIRTFGSRLDVNYNICRRYLDEKLNQKVTKREPVEFKEIVDTIGFAMEGMGGKEIAQLYNDIVDGNGQGDVLHYVEDSQWELEVTE